MTFRFQPFPDGGFCMRCQWFALLLLAGLAYGQTAPKPASPAAQTPAPTVAPTAPATAMPAPEVKPEAKVGPDDPVLTLKGLCDDPSKQGDACKTVIARAQFEKMADALQPGMSPAVRRQLANAYSRMLLMSTAAEKRGLDKKPQFDQMMQFARMQILSQSLGRDLHEETEKVSDADIDKYYNDNKSSYEVATVLRLFIPKTKQLTPAKEAKPADTEAQQRAGEAAMKKTAEELQARAAKGEDFDKLEKEAYVAAGLKGNPPSVKMDSLRQTMLPPVQKVAMQLKPGTVSDLISDASGHYVFKMISKETLTLDKVKPEIQNTIASQRFRDAMAKFDTGTNLELNEAYFGPTKPPAPPTMPQGAKPREGGEVEPD
jgi:parvulin-like peptidyl-prolyl isomerase